MNIAFATKGYTAKRFIRIYNDSWLRKYDKNNNGVGLVYT